LSLFSAVAGQNNSLFITDDNTTNRVGPWFKKKKERRGKSWARNNIGNVATEEKSTPDAGRDSLG
jgi:hypothetical protein